MSAFLYMEFAGRCYTNFNLLALAQCVINYNKNNDSRKAATA
jgi:hypothetical protein